MKNYFPCFIANAKSASLFLCVSFMLYFSNVCKAQGLNSENATGHYQYSFLVAGSQTDSVLFQNIISLPCLPNAQNVNIDYRKSLLQLNFIHSCSVGNQENLLNINPEYYYKAPIDLTISRDGDLINVEANTPTCHLYHSYSGCFSSGSNDTIIVLNSDNGKATSKEDLNNGLYSSLYTSLNERVQDIFSSIKQVCLVNSRKE